jgi:UDP-glucose 4-epimerase
MPDQHVILGGCGFIGRHVAVRLARAGHSVVLADRLPMTVGFPADVADRIEWRSVEIASANWDALIEQAAVVHHYAWSSIPASANANPAGDLTANVVPALDLLDALRRRGAGRLVFASSGGTVYGRVRQVPIPETHSTAPITAYGAGKAAAETYMMLYRALHGVDCRIARISNPYGAGQDLSKGLGAVTTFLHKALSGEPITIWGDGETVRDYIHISDVTAALATLAGAPRTDECVFHVGSGQGISLNGVVAGIEARLGRALAVTHTRDRSFDVPVNVLDIERTRALLGWSPRLSFSEGLALTVSDLSAGSAFSTQD